MAETAIRSMRMILTVLQDEIRIFVPAIRKR